VPHYRERRGENGKGGYMYTEVQIIEGGQLIKTEKMKLHKVKEFGGDITVYQNEDGRAVIHYKKKNEYVRVSIDMA
jgi:hypothetical protein